MRFHLIPESDFMVHGTEDDTCICGPYPRYDEGGRIVVVHHPLRDPGQTPVGVPCS